MRPGWRADALVLLFGVLGAMARESHALFLAASALAVLVQTWRDRPVGESLRAGLRAYPGCVARGHPLLVGAAGALLVGVLAFGTQRLIGSAYQPTVNNSVTFRGVLDSAWVVVSELAMGTGYVPMIIALPWLGHELLRPRSRGTGAFAVITLGMFVTFIVMVVYFATTTTTTGIGDAERYVAVLAGLPPLAAALALFRREVSPLAVAVAGLLLTRAIITQGLYPTTGPYDYFLAPARIFFTFVMQGQFSSRLPFSDHHIGTTLLLVIVAAAVAIALLLRHPGGLGRAGVAVCATLALGVPAALGAASGMYIGNKFEALSTFPTVSFDEQTFVDATGLKPVAFWDYAPGGDPRIYYEAVQAEFFNRSVKATLNLKGMPSTVDIPPNITATVNPRTGRLRTTAPLPEYLLEPVRFTWVGFDAQVVAGPSPVFGPWPFVVARFNGPPSIAWTVTGTEDEGWIPSPGHTATIRLFPTARPACWQTYIFAPPVLASPIHFSVTGPGLHESGTLAATATAVVHLHNPRDAPAIVRIAIQGGGKLASGAPVAASIYTFTPEACPQPAH